MKQRRELNIVKAICIILMVVGHAQAPAGVTGFIYLFHMPAFFFLSGYLFKESYLDKPLQFLKKRIGGLYVPYVFWELIFLVLAGVFFRLHFTTEQYSIQETLNQAFKYITFRGHQPLLNAYWFLKTLLFTAVICFVLLKFIKKGRWIIVGVLIALAGCCQLVEFDKTAMLSRLFLACAFYLTGNLFARGEYKISIPVAALSLCAVIAVSFFFRESIFVQGWKVIIYYPVALLGIYGVFGLSRALDKADGLARILDIVGRSTLSIMTFHFLSFKLASLLEVLIDKVPAEQMADFPYIHAHSALLWPLYSLVGIVLPVLIYCLKNRVYPRQNSLIRLF